MKTAEEIVEDYFKVLGTAAGISHIYSKEFDIEELPRWRFYRALKEAETGYQAMLDGDLEGAKRHFNDSGADLRNYTRCLEEKDGLMGQVLMEEMRGKITPLMLPSRLLADGFDAKKVDVGYLAKVREDYSSIPVPKKEEPPKKGFWKRLFGK